MTSRIVVASSLVVAALGAPACVVSVDHEGLVERVEKRFTVGQGPAAVRLITFDGSVEVRSWDRPEVLIQIDKRGQDKDALGKIEIIAEEKDGEIQVEARHSGGGGFVGIGFYLSPTAKLVASVPRNTNLSIRTGDGTVVIERVSGRAEVHTGDGSIRVTETTGQLLAETRDGSIQLEDVSGEVEARTGDGTIRLSGTPGTLRARSGDGSIVLRIRDGAAMTGDWMVATGDGSVTLELPDGFAAQIEADPGSDGRVRNDLSLANVTGGTRDKRVLTGTLGEGVHRLSVRTGDGTIRLTNY